jgi:hypothetical protein
MNGIEKMSNSIQLMMQEIGQKARQASQVSKRIKLF